MADNAELQAKIAALAGRINRHKAADAGTLQSHPQAGYQATDYGNHVYHGWAPQRGTPYGVPRGRGHGARSHVHRNRTLVVNAPGHGSNTSDSLASSASTPGTNGESSGSGWVSKRDRHMQLINTSVYDQKTQERTQAMAETRQQRLRAREEREKIKLQNHLHFLAHGRPHAVATEQIGPLAHQVIVNDIKFIVTDGGSKLIKVSEPLNMAMETPKRAQIGGVTFHRSKHGNLYRAGFIKTRRATDVKKIAQPCPQFSTTGSVYPNYVALQLPCTDEQRARERYCVNMLTHFVGSCSKGPLCRYEHNPNKVAICRDFLQTGKCQAGDDCDLSHDPTPERVPACLHFLRGNCTNADCRYAHVRTNPAAPICRAFATLGYCSKGAACPERHVVECPDFTNKGICRNKKCRLPHVHRAGQLRKAAALQQGESDEGQSSDISSDDELAAYDSDDVDSDDFEEDLTMPDAAQAPELAQQVDYVKF